MSEKRFRTNGYYINDTYYDGKKWLVNEVEAEEIESRKAISKLQKENELLRQQHQRLYNYFRDYLEDEMNAENFGEMWDNVKEDERWNDG